MVADLLSMWSTFVNSHARLYYALNDRPQWAVFPHEVWFLDEMIGIITNFFCVFQSFHSNYKFLRTESSSG
jgi:hypothetical protein